MTTDTLAEFLLARIDETERMLSVSVDHAEFLGSRLIDGRELVRADGEAKRRIVAELETFEAIQCAAADRDTPLPQALTAAGIVEGLRRAVRHLTVAYAGHPDFQEEWRP
ncbi:DUF6221 family protein [Angustibacter sp. McL0619]|uniref:DUF6221 family protein n=1 Tax=Angustibacter sp. McL0619 TaxID=3415676 RepID=UPI003CF951E5